MLTALKNFFRKRCLKKYASNIETGFIPVSSIRSAAVLLDIKNGDFRKTESIIMDYFRKKQISAEVIYIDFTKYKKGESTITSPELTIYGKDLNWFGKPSKEKCSCMLEKKKDLFISLPARNDFTATFIASAYPATFKIGGYTSESDPFDIIVSSPEDSDTDSLAMSKSIISILESIR